MTFINNTLGLGYLPQKNFKMIARSMHDLGYHLGSKKSKINKHKLTVNIQLYLYNVYYTPVLFRGFSRLWAK